GVVRSRFDGGSGVVGEDHDRARHLRKLAHRDRAGQIVERTHERGRLADALGETHARQRCPQRLRRLPSPHHPDVHAVSPCARHRTARREGSDSAEGTPRCRTTWERRLPAYRRKPPPRPNRCLPLNTAPPCGPVIIGGVSSQNCHHCSPQGSSFRRLSFWARPSSVFSFSSEGFSFTPFWRISIAFFFSPRWFSTRA